MDPNQRTSGALVGLPTLSLQDTRFKTLRLTPITRPCEWRRSAASKAVREHHRLLGCTSGFPL